MSHFVGHVFVPSTVPANEVENYLDETLDVYCESRDVEPYLSETIHAEDIDRIKERLGELVSPDPDKSEDENIIESWYGYSELKQVGPRSFELYSTFNPNSEWDWWVIGGRWSDFFGEGRGDMVRVKDIDWEAERDRVTKESHAEYDRFEEATKGLTLKHTWKDLYDTYGDDRRGEARETYHAQEWVKAAKTCADLLFEAPEVYFKHNAGGREAFITDKIAGVGVPYAFIDRDGEWVSRGDMGWFGISTDDKEPFDWAAAYFKYLDEVKREDPEALVVSIDFHI